MSSELDLLMRLKQVGTIAEYTHIEASELIDNLSPSTLLRLFYLVAAVAEEQARQK